MFVPPGFHIDSKIEGEGEKPKGETGEQPFIYPLGVGGLIMNGCFVTNYQKGDPCYEAKWKTTICLVNEILVLNLQFLTFTQHRFGYSPRPR